MKVLASGKRDSSAVEEDDDTSEGEGRGKRRRKRSTKMATFQREAEETGVGQIGLTGKAMRMRTEKPKRLEEMETAGENVAGRFVEGKFDEEQMDTDVKLEPVGNRVLEGEVLARIRKLAAGEHSEFHGSMKLGWVQICPFCQQEVGTLVDHVKKAHPDQEHRQIRTMCPYVECSRLVVDIRNHIRLVHLKIRNYQCDECDATFVNNYQVRKHKEGVHSEGKRIQCEECSMMLKPTTYENHVKRVHRGVRASVPCDEEGCGKVFGSKADLERHVLGKHMQWKLPCPECGKEFRSECLSQHIQTVHRGIYPFPCPHCKQGFQNQKGLLTHVRTRHRGVYLHCRAITSQGLECGKVLLSEEGLINHVESQHLGKEVPKMECPQCNIPVATCYLPEHLRRFHLPDNGLVCPIESCGSLVESGDSDLGDHEFSKLQKHIETIHGELGLEWCFPCKEFVIDLAEHNKLRHEANLWEGSEFRPMFGITLGTRCTHKGCDFMATGSIHLARHIKLKHETKINSTKCEICGKKSFDMERHHRIQHSKEKSLVCDHCEKKFLTPFALKKHQKIHTPIEDRTEKCIKCGAEVANMKQHVRFVHQKDLPYSCPEENCQTKFTSSLHLKKHMESVHQQTKVACPQCKKMMGVSSLASHMRIVHEKQRNHVCPECQKTFQNKSHLRNHLQRVHLGMKETCPDCGKQVQDLHSHRQFVHLKVKNFPCDQCETRCTSRNALRKHVSAVHLDQRSECPHCFEVVKHLEQHIRQRHRDLKKQHQCAECKKSFTCGSHLAKHIMHVHLETRETCADCGLETKDLARHKRTDCTREGYVVRSRKSKKLEKYDAPFLKEECASTRTPRPRLASRGIFWESEVKQTGLEEEQEKAQGLEEEDEKAQGFQENEDKALGFKEEEEKNLSTMRKDDPVTSDKQPTFQALEPSYLEVEDDDSGSVVSSIDITEDLDQEGQSEMEEEENIRLVAKKRELDIKLYGSDEQQKAGCVSEFLMEEDDFVIVAPILEEEEISNGIVLELDDDDLFFEASKNTSSMMIAS